MSLAAEPLRSLAATGAGEAVEIRRMLCGLRRKVLRAPGSDQSTTDNH